MNNNFVYNSFFMRTIINYCLVLFILPFFILSCKDDEVVEPEPIPIPTEFAAFPGAQGGGLYTTGGREGTVFCVTSLEDNALTPGTLRYALSQYGKKIIVFKVAGIINLNAALVIGSNVTIYGQSAPGDGICIKNYPVLIEGDNVILQFLRFRMGDEKGTIGDAFTCINRKNIIIDHCSFSWSTDECVSCYNNENFTLQYCIISESLTNSIHDKGSHGYGGIWGGTNASFHHNLLAHHSSRNPRFCGDRFTGLINHEKVDYKNNVVYNWGYRAGYAGEGGYYNLVNNYYKQGPASNSTAIFEPDSDPSNGGDPSELSIVLGGVDKPLWGNFYVSGNTFETKAGSVSQSYDWTGMYPRISLTRDGMEATEQNREIIKTQIKLQTEVGMLASISTDLAIDAYNKVLSKAGASFVRDAVDTRIIDNVQNGNYTPKLLEVTTLSGNHSANGLIDSQEEVGGWPAYGYSSVPSDSDRDGMPNDWEDQHGLNKFSASDANKKTLDPNGLYTNIEIYMNSLISHLY